MKHQALYSNKVYELFAAVGDFCLQHCLKYGIPFVAMASCNKVAVADRSTTLKVRVCGENQFHTRGTILAILN